MKKLWKALRLLAKIISVLLVIAAILTAVRGVAVP